MKRALVTSVLLFVTVAALGMVGCGWLSPATTTTSSTTTIITTTTTTEPPASWRQVDAEGEVPSARCFQALVYDPTTRKVVMFGGFDGTNALSETWSYDASANTWSSIEADSDEQPSAAEQLSGAFEPSTGKIVTFDGTSWGYDVETNKWKPLSPKGDKIKPARFGAAMVLDEASGNVILFGGTDRNTWYDETWSYDPAANAWTNLEPEGAVPSGRSGAGLAYDPNSRRVYLFGGVDEDYDCLNDAWSYDTAANSWTKLVPTGDVPSARSGMGMAYDPHSETIIVFGGIDSQFVCYEDTWALDATDGSWTRLDPEGGSPVARGRISLVYAADIDKLVLFGGVNVQPDSEGGFGVQAYLGDLWVFGVHLSQQGESSSQGGGTVLTTTTLQGAGPAPTSTLSP